MENYSTNPWNAYKAYQRTSPPRGHSIGRAPDIVPRATEQDGEDHDYSRTTELYNRTGQRRELKAEQQNVTRQNNRTLPVVRRAQ